MVKGDTIITGNYSLSFPPGHLVGTVAEIVTDPTTNFYVLSIRTGANFQNLQQVMLVENLQYEDQDKLLKDTKKIIEDAKKINR